MPAPVTAAVVHRATPDEEAATRRPAAPAADKWLISESVSPRDYTPVAVATASSNDGLWGLAVKLSIQCRGGRTDVVISGVSLSRHPDDYAVSYAIDEGPPVRLAATTPPSGSGVALKGDVVALLRSLPAAGTLDVRVAGPTGPAQEGRYALRELKTTLDRLAGPCKWPAGGPHN
jgi:hypothetical protein